MCILGVKHDKQDKGNMIHQITWLRESRRLASAFNKLNLACRGEICRGLQHRWSNMFSFNRLSRRGSMSSKLKNLNNRKEKLGAKVIKVYCIVLRWIDLIDHHFSHIYEWLAWLSVQ